MLRYVCYHESQESTSAYEQVDIERQLLAINVGRLVQVPENIDGIRAQVERRLDVLLADRCGLRAEEEGPQEHSVSGIGAKVEQDSPSGDAVDGDGAPGTMLRHVVLPYRVLAPLLDLEVDDFEGVIFLVRLGRVGEARNQRRELVANGHEGYHAFEIWRFDLS